MLFLLSPAHTAALAFDQKGIWVTEALAKPMDNTHGSGLGVFRVVVEHALSWFNHQRRIRVCYEKTGVMFLKVFMNSPLLYWSSIDAD